MSSDKFDAVTDGSGPTDADLAQVRRRGLE
jgi:hypothetical protein